jgi:mRNA-degrading endonuclease RelE of RelBE toxin-antitoxin system
MYTVVINASARKEMRALSREMQERVREAILSLAKIPGRLAIKNCKVERATV